MTAKLAYKIVMTLPVNERYTLFDMLEPHMKDLDFDELLKEDNKKENSKEEMVTFLIKSVFSKFKKS